MGHALIDDDHTGPGAEFPSIALAQIIQVALVHKEHRVTELLNTGLQAVGSGSCSVEANGTTMFEERAFTVLSTENKTGFNDVREKPGYQLRMSATWQRQNCSRKEDLTRGATSG